MKPYDLSKMDVEDLDRLLKWRPDLHKEIETAREQAECPHDELDHCVCLSCGKELDPGDVYGGAIDRAMDYYDEDRT
jgi:hypothetical protein